MKRKKKKKVNNQCSKQVQRASFNHFYRQIHHYLKVIDCEELAELFDKETCALLYEMRNSSLPKIRIAPGAGIRTSVKKRLQYNYDFLMSDEKIRINDHLTVNTKEVIHYLDLINVTIEYKGEECCDISTKRLIHKYNEKMSDFKSAYKKAVHAIAFSALKLGLMTSKMNTSICWIKHLHKPEGDEDRMFVLEVHEHIPKKEIMVIDSHPRPVYPVSLAFNCDGPREISVPAWRIRVPKDCDKPSDKSEFPVYFQNHLLHRLEERLDCIPQGISQYWFFTSLENPKFNYFQGKRLVEYHVADNTKVGYIVLEFHEGRLLAKTFLLLTNSGTPEGERLKELSGMQKCDLQYWAIDKLSTFQTSDLKDHPKTKALFHQAGCANLFEDLSSPDSLKGLSTPFTQAKQMIRYMEQAKEQEEMLMAV